MKRSGADTKSIDTQVAALMPLASLIYPAKIAPTIPPISNTIESSALASDVRAANKIKKKT